jgi:hypothetical protein
MIALGHEKNRIKTIVETSKETLDSKIINQFFENMNSNFKKNIIEYFYFDIEEMNFKNFSCCIDYVKSLKQYLSNIFQNSNILFVLSEYFANKNNKEINSIFNDSDNIKLFITDEITKLYNSSEYSNHSQTMKVFAGYDISYIDQNINMNSINNNEIISKIIEKIDRNLVKKYLEFLNNNYINNLSDDELMYIYQSIDINFKEKIDMKKITRPLDIIKNIYRTAPKANYYINVKNSLIKYLLKNQILSGVSSIKYNIEIKDINYNSNNIYLTIDNEMCIKIISESILNLIKISLRNKYLLNIIKSSTKINEIGNFIEEDEINLISTMVNDIYNIPSETSFLEKYQNTPNYFSVFKKLFSLLEIPDTYITNDNYLNSRMIIQIIKYGKINHDSLNYKCLSTLSDIFICLKK